jgi:hypothetical protein
MGYSSAWGKLIHEKILISKITCQTPFKFWRDVSLRVSIIRIITSSPYANHGNELPAARLASKLFIKELGITGAKLLYSCIIILLQKVCDRSLVN